MGDFLVRCEEVVTDWAAVAPGVVAVLKTGSRGRGAGQTDSHSDLDLLVLTSLPVSALVAEFPVIAGTVLVSRQAFGTDEYDLTLVGDDYSRLDVTVVRSPAADSVRQAIEPVAADKHLWRGFSVIVDRTARLDHGLLQPPPFRAPDASQVSNLAAQFWTQALRTAGFVSRGDLWRAQTLLVCRLRGMWLRLAEWQARLARPEDADTWYDGRHIALWSAPEARAALADFFAGYDQRELAGALLAMCSSFDGIAAAVSAAVGAAGPADGGIHHHIRRQLQPLAGADQAS